MNTYGITDTPPCPECGAAMDQVRRGASLRKRGTAFVCPVARNEHRLNVPKDDRKHKFVAAWLPEELAGAAMPAPTPEDNDLPF